jgi:hypothetical protein
VTLEVTLVMSKYLYGGVALVCAMSFTFIVGVLTERGKNPHLYDFVFVDVTQKIWVLDYRQTREDCDAHLAEYPGKKGYYCASAVYLEDAR